MSKDKKKRLLLLLCSLGLGVAAFAGMAEHVQWLASLCSGFSDGCRETVQYTLLGLPIWLWGVGFYLTLGLVIHFRQRLMFWLVAGGFGMELSLMWIMFAGSVVCVFCLGNFVVVLLLVLFSMEKERFWQMLAVCLSALIVSLALIPQRNAVPASSSSGPAQRMIASVADRTIHAEEIEKPLEVRIFELEREVYRLKRDFLDQMIVRILLEKEAAQRGISPQQLINEVTLLQKDELEDAELERYYQENRGRVTDWKGTEAELMQQMRASLQQRKAQQQVLDYARSLRSKYEVVVYLKEPPSPHVRVSMENNPVLGPAEAPLTIVEFSDYQCPACRKNHEVIRQLRAEYPEEIRWVFKDFPMAGHKWARKAAEAAHCAGDQGKFWEYQDRLFSGSEELAPEQLKQRARELGLRGDEFDRCLDGGKYQGDVEKDVQEGKKAGLSTTPSFVINGRLIPGGPPLERFKEIIEEELGKVRARSG
jgi:protein-disulfide isomerase